MKVISFCIYGSKEKYCRGLLENIEIIKQILPDFYVFIYVGNDVPHAYIEKYILYDKVKLIYTNRVGHDNMINRFFAIDDDDVDVMIVRDADSRIHKRDYWCILHFIQNRLMAHTIRDHPDHKTPIMGGLWGLKKGLLTFKIKDLYISYNKINPSRNTMQYDQTFLRDVLYRLMIQNMIIYVNNPNLRLFSNEMIYLIPFPLENEQFCGQVIEYDNDKPYIKRDMNMNMNNYGIPNLKNMSNILRGNTKL